MTEKRKYNIKVEETTSYTIQIEAKNAKEAKKLWKRYKDKREADDTKVKCELTCIATVGVTPESELDVHTEHCCLTCGCKYSDKRCTVTTEQKIQSYSHETQCCW